MQKPMMDCGTKEFNKSTSSFEAAASTHDSCFFGVEETKQRIVKVV
jgi:hypothetical protein